ncbi:MAG: DUF4339 domain-containing protein [Pseudomonadota bacterium]
MRAEAISWDDWSVSNPPPIANEDKWHVQIAADEVKIISLEQLDDLFRLSIVDSETQVWQTGMSEWQPLRVIAGLEEQPAPQPKRAPPKPPARAASPSVRPPAPAHRPVELSVVPAPRSMAPAPSVRPPAPAPRSAPPPAARPAYVAPASFYPEPIVGASASYPPPVAYAEPISFAAPVQTMNSVRPLVVSHAPPPMARGGGGFGRFLIGLSLLAGVGVTAYRNDFVREGAHAAHQDALYARLESALGGPAFGTVRALEQSSAAQSMPELNSSNNEPAVRTAITVASPAAPDTQVPSISTGVTTPPVVSLESLAHEQKGQPIVKVEAAVTPPPAPVRAAASFVQPKQAVAPAPAKAAPARAAAAPKAAKAVVERPAPVAQKPTSEMTDRERLNAAIGQSMMQADAPKSKGKAKAKASEYDPLNPNL